MATLMIYTIAILLSLVGYFVIGHLAGRRVKGLDDYLVAGRNAPTFFILGTLVASYQSSSASDLPRAGYRPSPVSPRSSALALTCWA
jgi:Na+/pantothenate symporter